MDGKINQLCILNYLCNKDKQVFFEEACSTAEEFTKLYYECMDKKRNVRHHLERMKLKFCQKNIN